MTIQYFVRLCAHDLRPTVEPADLAALGLKFLARLGDGMVFASDSGAVLKFANGDLLIGELFLRDGRHVTDMASLPKETSFRAVRDFVLTQCWGDYVLLQQIPGDSRAFALLRSPTPVCDLQCVYSLGDAEGFITSDITLAMRLGLYERRVDPVALVRCLAYPNLKASSTALLGVSELPPGSALHVTGDALQVTSTWTPWDFVRPEQRYPSFEEAALEVRRSVDMVISAYADRHQCVLLELSGGLDSSIVGTSLMGTPARVVCQSLTTPLPGTQEQDYARSIAELLGVQLAVRELDFDEVPFRFPVPRKLCAPSTGMLQFAVDRVMRDAAEMSGSDGYFSGAGGDSVFCFLSTASPAADAVRSAGLRRGLRTVGDLADFHQCTFWKAGGLAMRRLFVERPPLSADTSLLVKSLEIPKPETHPWNDGPDAALPGDRERIAELASTQLFRGGCARGLARPLRMPLLAQPVIEACLRAPSWMWFRGGQNRAVARQAFADRLPGNVLNRKSKSTFTAYLGAIYRRKGGELLHFLTEGRLQAHGILDADALRNLRRANAPADEAFFMRVFQLCAVENWMQQQSQDPR
ncbi:MAG: asparagine synthase [Pseudoxanthomonas spadix]|nr:MAG: asparagine synthase [Pseudoxanthomonas spadix]